MNSVARVTKGAVTIPVRVRREAGLREGAIVGFEVKGAHIVVRPVVILPAEDHPTNAGSDEAKSRLEGA